MKCLPPKEASGKERRYEKKGDRRSTVKPHPKDNAICSTLECGRMIAHISALDIREDRAGEKYENKRQAWDHLFQLHLLRNDL